MIEEITRKIWDKFTEFTFLNSREISKVQKNSEVNCPQISRINMWFLINHMWQALKEHTSKGKNYTKKNQSKSTNLINITP